MTTIILVIAITIVSIILLTISSRLFKINRDQADKIAGLQNQLSVLCVGAIGTDERILQFEQRLTKIKEHQNSLDVGMNAQHSYDHAIRLARKGAGINQLIDSCNLSDEEAHLIRRLHGGDLQNGYIQEIH
ncbi:hypothetical protein A9Q78_04705 [Methylophaga sp. 41_12_T18]|nr:hypothetical protein A9Q78_04705 [Methylophaga sp. 41_12_T18]